MMVYLIRLRARSMYVWCYSSWRCWFSACLGGMPLNVCSVGIESRPHTHSIKQKQTELQMSPPSFPPVSVCYATARAATTVLFTTLLCKFYRQLQLKWVFVSFDISRNVSISIVRLRNLKTLSMPARRTQHTVASHWCFWCFALQTELTNVEL